ncbi:MAG: DoxX family membrane protein [Bacteroidetes bacterium]|jgi:putative oxidoreductase|nr:DoxX family membrane protein [Bacteroidota bacterium]
MLNSLDKYRDYGILLIRLGFGLYMFFGHGWGKISAGPERWTELGGTMGLFGITFLPVVWGFLAAIAESVCALLVTAGFLFRPALILLIGNMIVAASMHIITGNGSPEMAILYGLVWLGLLFVGPGPYSLDASLGGRR